MGRRSRTSRWMSYDSVAQVYRRAAVPWFAPIAADLVAAVRPESGETLLDLGAGTGLVAGLAAAAVAPSGFVVGLDPSTGMLKLVTPADRLALVAGGSPGLPFAAEAFDAVTANFVISHLPDLHAGLRDVGRVLRPAGRLGCTAWGGPVPAGPTNDLPEADALVAVVRRHHGIDLPPPQVDPVPFEEHLYSKDSLVAALAEAGFADIEVRSRRYHGTVAVEDYLSGWGSRSRHLRNTIGERRWSSFVQDATVTVRDRFGDSFSRADDVRIAVGRRP